MQWKDAQCIAHPYVVNADEELLQRIAETDMVKALLYHAVDFTVLKADNCAYHWPTLCKIKIETYIYQGLHVTNFEMESSAVAGLSNCLDIKP